MKKFFTILFISVVLLSGTTFRYSAHYCQGNYITSMLSLSGENASCGMSQKDDGSKNVSFSNLMCVNEITSYTFCNNYTFTPQPDDTGKNILKDVHNSDLPLIIAPRISLISISKEFSQLPPGSPGPLKAEREILCVFRI